jgi:GT2 family glycosyltransferase
MTDKTAIIIVSYNQPALLVRQLECIRKFCTDDFDIVVIDNSNDKEAAKAIKYHSGGAKYIKVN